MYFFNHIVILCFMPFSFKKFQTKPFVIMGILNTTPDSFSDGGVNNDIDTALQNALKMQTEGADIIDIGGESTKPGAQNISIDEELSRVIPTIERIRANSEITISIDTTKALVAEEAIKAGADIVNDISAATKDPEMKNVIARLKPSLVIMHMKGTPQDMQNNPQYDFVTFEIIDFLRSRLLALNELGIASEEIIIDPGIGFGKTYEHNLNILKNLDHFLGLHQEILIGVSRKILFEKMLGAKTHDRVIGTASVNIWCWQHGVKYFRVHDVKATQQALKTYQTLTGRYQ